MRGRMILALHACAALPGVFTGCTRDGVNGGVAAMERPAEIRAAVAIEGRVEQLTLSLVESPADFALRFSTYVPRDYEIEVAPGDSGEGEALTIGLEPDRRSPTDAFVHVYAYPRGTIAPNARSAVRAFLISRGIPGDSRSELRPEGPRTLPRYEWASVQQDFAYDAGGGGHWSEGVLLLGHHGDLFFHVVLNYPMSNRSWFVPRARTLLEHWRWEDTGTMLQQDVDTERAREANAAGAPESARSERARR